MRTATPESNPATLIEASCPVCGALDCSAIYPEHAGECITSDLQIVPQSTIANRLCEACGFIFNAGGPRGRAEEFYRGAYRLRMHSDGAQNINFSASGAVPMARAVADFLVEVTGGRESGSILEAGAGKGEILLQFLNLKSAWQSVAFEPSSAATRLKERLPNTKVIHAGYRDAAIEEEFDLVLSAAVVEHVEKPLEFIRWLGQRVNPRGRLVLTFPDFSRNPNDLFCIDHLSKISGPQLEMMARCAGLRVIATKHVGIAMFAALERAGAEDRINPVLDAARELIARNTAAAEAMVEAVASARRTAKERNEVFAVFGLGMAGLVAPVLRNFPRAEIAAYIDENPTMQGLTIGGSPVIGLGEIASRNIRHVALSVSPVYRAQVVEKLRPYGVSVYA